MVLKLCQSLIDHEVCELLGGRAPATRKQLKHISWGHVSDASGHNSVALVTNSSLAPHLSTKMLLLLCCSCCTVIMDQLTEECAAVSSMLKDLQRVEAAAAANSAPGTQKQVCLLFLPASMLAILATHPNFLEHLMTAGSMKW